MEKLLVVFSLRYSFQRQTGVIIEVVEYLLDNEQSFEDWELIQISTEAKMELDLYKEHLPQVCKRQIEFLLIRISEILHNRKENQNESTT
jgi:hypothetical protein